VRSPDERTAGDGYASGWGWGVGLTRIPDVSRYGVSGRTKGSTLKGYDTPRHPIRVRIRFRIGVRIGIGVEERTCQIAHSLQ